MSRPILTLSLLVTVCLLGAATALAQPLVLTAEQWRVDLDQLAGLIVEEHPDPFHIVSEAEFRSAVDALAADIPELDDRRIIVRLAQVVALIGDGHTRLAIPRQHEDLGFSFSHSAPKPVSDPRLEFSSLPLRFRVFPDGVHVVEADRAHQELIGAQVLAIGGVDIQEIRRRISTINYIDNEMTDMLLTGDRLSLPEALWSLDIIEDPGRVRFTVRPYGSSAEDTVTVWPLPRGEGSADELLAGRKDALWLSDPSSPKWARMIADGRACYIQLNQIENATVPLGDYIRDRLAQAERGGADRVIVDLRHNHGGNAGYNLGLINALTASPYNAYGKIFFLIGRETFSAAQMLLNELEQYTDAIFVGEPSGSSPGQFGDPRRVQLGHSGLTLRVSRLFWSSWRAFDDREATSPHVNVAYTIDDYMNGEDPVLQTALTWEVPGSLADLVGEIMDDGLNWHGAGILLLRHATDPRVQTRDPRELGDGLVRVAERYESQQRLLTALYLFDLSRRLTVDDPRPYLGWARTALALGEKEEALNALEAGVRALPENKALREALEKQNGSDP